MKWIILAGGLGTRLHPITLAISKQLMPVYDKPMIYYPLSVLMLAGIRDILIITTPYDQESFQRLLSDWSQWWIRISYAIQPEPNGLAEAFTLWETFIGHDDVCLVLGDNIFYGQWLSHMLKTSIQRVADEKKAVVYAYEVTDPERYGVVEFAQTNMSYESKKNPQYHSHPLPSQDCICTPMRWFK